ncbi:MAG: hypothetical protein COU25_04205 [Candidatus Levybacteria bacterium CG10_big_fil_rev_8_21_14_0_10_35_13]|nr:MAG: hypothetical protein COU25_04205 [Candidatus Levybacteria bacterium CG10_big_fil_rev_8_21_14_0_10_35_13]
MSIEEERNSHYSEQTGHNLRGVHKGVVIKLNGYQPEAIPGFSGIEGQRIRRSMRRVTKTGKR